MTDTEPKFPSIIRKSVYRGMTPQEQEEYVERKIKETVKLNPQGISIPAIDNNTPFSRATIIKHLERMVSGREAYKIKHPNLTIYYHNGKPVHEKTKVQGTSDSGSTFRVTLLNNNMGQFFYVEDLSTHSVSGGSILVKKNDFNFFRKIIEEAYKKEAEYDA
jgi:hypothetical protein